MSWDVFMNYKTAFKFSPEGYKLPPDPIFFYSPVMLHTY